MMTMMTSNYIVPNFSTGISCVWYQPHPFSCFFTKHNDHFLCAGWSLGLPAVCELWKRTGNIPPYWWWHTHRINILFKTNVNTW